MNKIRIALLILALCLIAAAGLALAGPDFFPDEILKVNAKDRDFMAGCSSASMGRHHEAIESFSRVLYRDAYDSAAYYRRGLSYLALHERDLAIQDFEYAMGGVGVESGSLRNYKNLSLSFAKSGNPKQIIPAMEKILREHPDDADAFYNRGTAFLALGNLDRAIADLGRAIELKPQDLEYHYNRKMALQRSDAVQRIPSRSASSGKAGSDRKGQTKVKIIGNSVFVPVTLEYEGNSVDADLLLDTGATGTAIHSDIADQLSIDLSRARKTKVHVVGGNILEAGMVKVSSLTIGPHTKHDWRIFIVPQKSPVKRYNGLLGMDILRDLRYEVDFKNQVILWK